MNTFTATLYRDLTCAMGALLITLVMGLSFVQSTATPPDSRAAAGALAIAPLHGWFGQPEPAVLVD